MIINLCQGGESTITVYGPGTSSISVTGGGETVTGTIASGSTSVSLKVHTISTYTVTCTYSNSTKSGTVSITTFGESKSISFSYAVINVYTHPGASVRAFKSGVSDLTGTADSNGYCLLPVPAGSLNSTAWTVRATDANSTGVYEDKTATTNSLTADPTVYPLYRIPIIKVSWSGGSATSYGNGMDNGYAKISGTNSWKMWVKASCTVTFLWIKTKVHFWGIGKGGDGSAAFYDTDSASPYGGGSGGGGGQVKTGSNVTVSVNSGYTVTIGSATSFGSIMSCNAGGNGGRMSGGSSGGNSGNGSSGEWVNDHSYPPSSGGGGSGGEGVYAFGDSSFDGVRYGHGGGGGAHSSSTPGYHSTTAGSGGGGAGHSGNAGRTNGNNGIFCLKPGDNI